MDWPNVQRERSWPVIHHEAYLHQCIWITLCWCCTSLQEQEQWLFFSHNEPPDWWLRLRRLSATSTLINQAPVLNYTIHLCPEEMEMIEGKKRGKIWPPGGETQWSKDKRVVKREVRGKKVNNCNVNECWKLGHTEGKIWRDVPGICWGGLTRF